uniref:IS91 family transposase n=1 Tax=Blautia liquoris TaxID=2779518 RepID=UPI001E326477|nr:transposase [Blautia liquoris]
MHCIVSGGGLTVNHKLRKSKSKFFIPVKVLRDKFKGKYLALLEIYHNSGKLSFSSSCKKLQNSYHWKEWKNHLYEKDWCPYIKETFNGFGNAIEYLGKYTHKIAISNSRILSVTPTKTTFSARGKRPDEPNREIILQNTEFIRRFLMHVLPSGFQKIRYYGFLNKRMKTRNLKILFKLQGCQRFKRRYIGLSMTELLKTVWNFDICLCPKCGFRSMKQLGRRNYAASW